MAKTIELYWDIGSTNTYFALKLIGSDRQGTQAPSSSCIPSISAMSSATITMS